MSEQRLTVFDRLAISDDQYRLDRAGGVAFDPVHQLRHGLDDVQAIAARDAVADLHAFRFRCRGAVEGADHGDLTTCPSGVPSVDRPARAGWRPEPRLPAPQGLLT